MPDEEPAVPFERRFRHGLRQNRAAVSIVVFAIGVFLSLLAVGYFTPLKSTSFFQSVNSVTVQGAANYNLLFVILGPIVAIVGAYLVGAYFSARRKFEHLMLTKSKAEFLRNIPELEDLLWDLTPIDEERYEAKRADFRMKR
jgi:ABC-type phosphate transport system permease subunit